MTLTRSAGIWFVVAFCFFSVILKSAHSSGTPSASGAQLRSVVAPFHLIPRIHSMGSSDGQPSVAVDLPCPHLISDFARGDTDASTNGQVSAFQRFLAVLLGINERDIVTGFFGDATQGYTK